MASGFRNSAGVDFDSLFDPYQQGTAPAATGFRTSDGVDLAGRYAPIAFGTKGPDVGYRTSAGTDLSNLWAAAGTATYPLPINGASFIGRASGLNSPNMDANVTLSINADGTYQVTCVGNTPDTTAGASGTWLPSGQSASDYDVEFVWTQSNQYPTGAATVTNEAATYQACTSSHQISANAQVGQLSGNDRGSVGTFRINLKRISTGVVTATVCDIDVESFGSG